MRVVGLSQITRPSTPTYFHHKAVVPHWGGTAQLEAQNVQNP